MFNSLIARRRSIRKYTDQQVEAEKIEKLAEAALRSPSGLGKNPWEFIIVTDRVLLEKLADSKQAGSAFLKGAAVAIVVCVDPDKSNVWVEDASIASIYIHLAAESLGLGSCWVQIREKMHDGSRSAQDYVADLLNIPSHLIVESIISIGYPAEEKSSHKSEDLQYEKVYNNLYGNPKY
jgi:nitroreductase